MKADDAYISIYKAIGVNAARLRSQQNRSQTFVAERAGIDRSALNRFESGKYNPSIEWLCKLADGLGVPVVEFFSGLEGSTPGEIAKAGARGTAKRE